mmetsp:Transcript_9952/g.27976  ORF Transcript_9952/g.27976 Transcript_9952/m.27976 type:complete len:201 (-) Transcript_9952:79-681(-)
MASSLVKMVYSTVSASSWPLETWYMARMWSSRTSRTPSLPVGAARAPRTTILLITSPRTAQSNSSCSSASASSILCTASRRSFRFSASLISPSAAMASCRVLASRAVGSSSLALISTGPDRPCSSTCSPLSPTHGARGSFTPGGGCGSRPMLCSTRSASTGGGTWPRKDKTPALWPVSNMPRTARWACSSSRGSVWPCWA